MALDWLIATTPPRLADHEAQVWAVPLADPVGRITLDRQFDVLSVDERLRANEFRIERPRRQFVTTRAALRTLLGAYLGERPEEIAFSFESIAKPRLAGKYDNTGVRFNVSHSGDLALVAVTRGCDIGVDVEQRRDVRRLDELARRYFHVAEVARVTAVAAELRSDAFLRCWTAKEAILKLYGTGITSALDAFSVPLADDFAGWIDISGLKSRTRPGRCWLQRLEPCGGYVGAVAMFERPRAVTCFTFSTAAA